MRLYLSAFRLGNRPELMIDLLGGGARRVAVITNAADYRSPDEPDAADTYQSQHDDLAGLGLEPTHLDLRDHFDRPDSLAERLAGFDLVWVRGGNVFVLRRAFCYSGADVVIPKLLADDRIAYAGYSAGACVLTPSLRGLDLVDDPHQVPAGYDAEIIWDGLGIVPFSLLPHYRSPEHPETEPIDRVADYLIDNHIPFVALRDGQALVRDGDRQFVTGQVVGGICGWD